MKDIFPILSKSACAFTCVPIAIDHITTSFKKTQVLKPIINREQSDAHDISPIFKNKQVSHKCQYSSGLCKERCV